MNQTIHRIIIAYAYEWRLIRLRRQVEWWLEQCRDLGAEVMKLVGQILLVPVALVVIAAHLILWLPWCFLIRPIYYGFFRGEDVDKVEQWRDGRKKQPLVNS